MANTEPAGLIAPTGLVLGGLLLGFVFERIALSTLRDRLSGTRLDWGGVVQTGSTNPLAMRAAPTNENRR